MDSALLATKLQIPPQPPHSVPRPRLLDILEHEVPHARLTLVAAPAGSGKTTLLAQWARTTRFPVVWLTLGPEDADADRLLRYLLRGWEGVRPGIRRSPLGILLEGMSQDRQAVLTAFVNVAAAAADPLVFVLDDYHLLADQDPTVDEALAFLIDHLPPPVHFILAGRTDPALPLARYRARGELLELRGTDLAFAPDETATFLRAQRGQEPAPAEVARVQAQLEGWAAGLQLAALGRRRFGADDAPGPGGRQRFVADYLAEDVLAAQPDAIQEFLLQTSILDQLCAPLCDAVTAHSDGQATLEELERRNLFLLPLDDRREWFRYQRPFAAFLREELRRRDPDTVAPLHARAARWYLAQGLPDPALQHAVAAHQPDIAERVLDDYATVKLQTGELRDVARWLNALPPAWHTAYPSVGLTRAGLFVFTGDMASCLQCIEAVEQRLSTRPGDQARADWGKLNAVRCAIACIHDDLDQAEAYADRALHDLPEEDPPYRHLVHGALGDSYRRRGRWADARRAYLAVLALPEGPGYQWHAVHVRGALADLALHQGRLREAAGHWRQALATIEEPATWGRLPLPLIGWVYIRLGEILYEWNDPAEAADLPRAGPGAR